MSDWPYAEANLPLHSSLHPIPSWARSLSWFVRQGMRAVFTTLTLLALTGCSDVVTQEHATLADAKSHGALERGLLPPSLPDSARAIVERHNLDSNRGTGSFDYDLSERAAYLGRLSGAGAVSRPEGDSDVLTVTTNGSRWEIRLPRTSGVAEWSLRPR